MSITSKHKPKESISFVKVEKLFLKNGATKMKSKNGKTSFLIDYKVISLETNKRVDWDYFIDICEDVLDISWWEIDFIA